MSATHVNIHLIPGSTAPRQDEASVELDCDDVTITETATQANLPIVDFRCRGSDGKLYLLTLTGRIVNAISAAVRGANARNHGKEEP